MDMNSLSHTKWECKYHIVFAPKFRRKVAYGQIKQDIANILSTLCKRSFKSSSGVLHFLAISFCSGVRSLNLIAFLLLLLSYYLLKVY